MASENAKKAAEEVKADTHLCNCDFCDKKAKCLVCNSDKELQRAHIIPQRIINLWPQEFGDYKDKWLSYSDFNIVILCKKHHVEYDLFKLSDSDAESLRPYLFARMKEFLKITDWLNSKTTFITAVHRKFFLWFRKQHKWMIEVYGK